MKATCLVGLAFVLGWCGESAAQSSGDRIPAPYQPMPTKPAASPSAPLTAPVAPPPTSSPIPAAPAYATPTYTTPTYATPAPVIHYHVYQAPAGVSGAGCAACSSCGTGASVCGGENKSWIRSPAAAFKQKCADLKRTCEENSCSYGKTFYDFGCTDCRLDCLFIFGSCHEFFQEPCRRNK